MNKNTQILDSETIANKTTRIAYQILENNYDEKEIVLVGIHNQGYVFAGMLADIISNLGKMPVKLFGVKLNKVNPSNQTIEADFTAKDLAKRSVILVDDVANTGKTLAYALTPILDSNPKKIQVAVLVDRRHKQFPITADFVGLSLATTLKEHIVVSLEKGKVAAYLS